MPPVRITGARITPVAFADPPLLNTVGVHQPFALRAITLIPELSVASSVAPLVLSVAVWPATEVAVEAQGLALSAQALTVTGVGRQARLAEGIDSS